MYLLFIMKKKFVITLNRVVGTGKTVPPNFALVSRKQMHFKINKNYKLIQIFNQGLLYEIWYLNIFTGVICGAGTANNIGSPELTARFVVGFMLLDLLVFCVIFCRTLFAS